MTALTPKARRILGFIEGFARLHRCGPDFSQIWAYETGNTVRHNVSSQMRTLLGRLEDQGYIRRVGARYVVVKPQRSVAFAYDRRTETLERISDRHQTQRAPGVLQHGVEPGSH